MVNRKPKHVLSESESKELLKEYAERLQRIDEVIKNLQEEKRDIVKSIKEKGLNHKALNEAIKRIRKNKKNPSLEEETDLYIEYIEELIEPLE